ncbi:MAG: hypothetical protein GX608_07315 [Lentisphaerae bacterium]|nr:hypothetical protein [Lentisphaerota bacterium]
MNRTLAFLALILTVFSAPAATSSALLSQVKCDFTGLGHVEALALQPDGKVLVGGSFDFINGRPRRNLARLTRDGALDETWMAEANDFVCSIVPDGDYVYVAGYFSAVNDADRVGVARLRAEDGAIDETWNANVDGPVFALALDGTNVYLGGGFSAVGGENIRALARVAQADGAADTNWVPGIDEVVYAIQVASNDVYVGGVFGMIGADSASNLGRVSKETGAMDTNWLGSAQDDVLDLAIDGDKLYVAGESEGSVYFLAIQGNSGLVRLDLNTGIKDTNWNPRVAGTVRKIAVEDTVVYAVGEFARVGSALKRNIVRMDKAGGAADMSWCQGAADYCCALAYDGRDLYVGGLLKLIGTSAVSGIARLDSATGGADPDFEAYCETPAEIMALARQADGKIIVGGYFHRAGGAFRSNLARLCPDGAVDPAWAPDPDSAVFDLALDGTNIYAGGAFSVIGGRTRVGVARLSMEDGAADAAWESPLGGFPITAASDGGSKTGRETHKSNKGIIGVNVVNSLAVDGAAVYIGGLFFTGGDYPMFSLAKLSKVNGSVLTEFDAQVNGNVSRLALDGNNLYVSGPFNWIGGEPRCGLARLNAADGTADPAWDAMADDEADVISVHGESLYVSGYFDEIGGLSNTFGLARLNKISAAGDPDWLPLAPPEPAPSFKARSGMKVPYYGLNDIAISGSHVVLAGEFWEIGGETNAGFLARVSVTNDGCDKSWLPMPDRTCTRLLAVESELFACGLFSAMAGAPRLGFARLFLDAPRASAGISASKGKFTDKVDVSWMECPGADVYELWRSLSTNISSASLLAGNICATNFNDTSALPGINYYYWLRGTNGLGAGAFVGPESGWRRSRAGLCGQIGDYDGDGRSDLAIFDQTRALWYAYSLAEPGGILAWDLAWGATGDITVVGDYDGDYVHDWCAFHPATVSWYVQSSAGDVLAWDKPWGSLGIVPVPGDYDGDGISDLAAYVKEGGYWYIWSLANGVITWANPWGWALATPVPGDYDGDGNSDMAVYDSAGGNWYVWSLTRETVTWATPWGGGGMVAVPGDFDGDGMSDLAVYDAELGKWYAYSLAGGGRTLVWEHHWGMPGTIPVPGDFDGDGANDWAVYDTLNGQWYIQQSSDGHVLAWEFQFGYSGVMPVTSAGR